MAKSIVILATLASIATAIPILHRNTCYSGLYMIVARGSDEAAGEGKPGVVADLIAAQVPNSGSVAVDYPATIISSDSAYPESVTDGINDTLDKIWSYVSSCGDDSRIVLVGYSQGANVMTDVLAGGVDKPAPLNSTYMSYITGVVVFGDPAFTAGQSFDAGNSTTNGIFSRGDSSLALLNTYSSVIQSYCDVGDPFCADGDDLDVHYAEVSDHEDEAASFIVSLA